jgi:hypothetical protein
MDSLFTSPEFHMSLLATFITPIVYRNWFYNGEYCTYDDKGACLDTGK